MSGGTRIRTGDTMIFRLVRRSGAPRGETAWAATRAFSIPCGPRRTPSAAADRRHRCGTSVVCSTRHGRHTEPTSPCEARLAERRFGIVQAQMVLRRAPR
jgi:hypothetical protein